MHELSNVTNECLNISDALVSKPSKRLIQGHHGPCIVELATIVGSTEQRHLGALTKYFREGCGTDVTQYDTINKFMYTKTKTKKH